MPFDLPPAPVSAYVSTVESGVSFRLALSETDTGGEGGVDGEAETVYLDDVESGEAPESQPSSGPIFIEEGRDGIPLLQSGIEEKASFSSKALWGPIKARMLPSTKKTLAKLVSETIRSLSAKEYQNLRFYIEYMVRNPSSRQRIFELTGFTEKDLLFAEKYFRQYETRGLFAKLLEFALSTSSDGNVSRQIGGLVQFIFEVGEIEGKPVSEVERYKLVRLLPATVRPLWDDLTEKCADKSICLQGEKAPFFDLNDDDQVDQEDLKIARASLQQISRTP